MKCGQWLSATLSFLTLAILSYPASSISFYPAHFGLAGAVFDDGGTADGGFDFNFDLGNMPLPQFYNVQITTSTGSTLPGSQFVLTSVCYNKWKKFVCAPGADLLINLETGIPGEPGYDRFQFATFFAPQALVGRIGVLDTTASYEIGCTQSGCFARRIVSGAIRYGMQ
jgi:hypothetical protein